MKACIHYQRESDGKLIGLSYRCYFFIGGKGTFREGNQLLKALGYSSPWLRLDKFLISCTAHRSPLTACLKMTFWSGVIVLRPHTVLMSFSIPMKLIPLWLGFIYDQDDGWNLWPEEKKTFQCIAYYLRNFCLTSRYFEII